VDQFHDVLSSAVRALPVPQTRRTQFSGQARPAREGDGTFMDHQMIGRAYATAQALCILAPR
jgi:hypothetical protein